MGLNLLEGQDSGKMGEVKKKRRVENTPTKLVFF